MSKSCVCVTQFLFVCLFVLSFQMMPRSVPPPSPRRPFTFRVYFDASVSRIMRSAVFYGFSLHAKIESSHCQSPEQLQPIRTSQILIIPYKIPDEWSPCLAHRLKHSHRARDWWNPKEETGVFTSTETSKVYKGRGSWGVGNFYI